MKLEGTLTTFPLRELVSMITYSSVTGVLNIYTATSSGHLYFNSGQLCHADTPEHSGLDALTWLVDQREARFSFVSDVVPSMITIRGDSELHINNAERMAQRWRNIRALVPNLMLIPVPLMTFDEARRYIHPTYYDLFSAIDGHLTVAALAKQLSWAPIEMAEAVAQLCGDGVVELHSAPPCVNTEAPVSAPQGMGLFDRVRATLQVQA